MSKKFEELNEAKKRRFEGRKIEQIQVDVKYDNYHVNEIMDLILPDDTPRYAIKANPLTFDDLDWPSRIKKNTA